MAIRGTLTPFMLLAGFAFSSALSGHAHAATPGPYIVEVDQVMIGSVSGFSTGPTNPFVTRILDSNSQPLAGVLVKLQLPSPTLRLYNTQSSGSTVDCPAYTISKLTDSDGYAIFLPRFGRFTNQNLVEVRANDDIVATVRARSFDIDGLDGTTGLPDLQIFATKYMAVLPTPEVNFDESPSDIPDLSDFAMFATQYLAASVGIYCP
jgi:hypothetical protein